MERVKSQELLVRIEKLLSIEKTIYREPLHHVNIINIFSYQSTRDQNRFRLFQYM